MKIIAELLAEAVEECITCGGTGWRFPPINPSGWGTHCVDCRGNGKALTTEGWALVEFLELWLGRKFAEADHGHSLH